MDTVIRSCITKSESIKTETKKKLQTWLICVYFFIAFFEPYLNGILGAVTKYYVFFLVFYILLSEREIRINKIFCCYLFWFVLKIISLIRVSDTYISDIHFFSHIGMLMLLFAFETVNTSEYLIKHIALTEWIGSFSIGVLSLFLSHPYHGTVSTRQVLFLFGQEADPNNQAAFLLVGIAVALYYIFKRKYIIFASATILVNVYSCFLTGSRGGFLGILCIAFVFILVCIREYKTKSLKWIILFLGMVVVIYFITRNFLSKEIADRLFSFDSYEGGSERDIIWGNVWELYSTGANFLFGAGWGAYYGYNGIFMAVHNTFLSMLCDVGIVGFSLFFVPVVLSAYRLWKNKCYLPIFILVASLVPSFFIEAINKRFFWNAIFILFIFYSKNLKRGNNKVEV